MNILILGATGFIGNAIFLSLVNKHNVTIAGRRPLEGYDRWKKIDFSRDNDWDNLLEDIDLVINAIGIIEGDFEQIQKIAPLKLYANCIKKEIKIIHISAIGAEKDNPITDFLSTKKETDNYLLKYDKAKIVYPGVVIGRKGKSTQFLAEISNLPFIPLLSEKTISFIHIEQLTGLIQKIVYDFDDYPSQVFAVSKPEPIRDVFSALKGGNARFVKIPKLLFQIFFLLFPNASIGIFNKATYKMFQSGSVSDYTPLFPEVSKKINPNNITRGDTLPQLFALLAISFIWLCSGICSLVSWDESYDLINEIGANHQLSVLFIWLGSIVDIFLGIAIFSKRHRKNIIKLQILTMLIYMIILSISAPHYWLHPFGALSKNIPLLALSYFLYRKEE